MSQEGLQPRMERQLEGLEPAQSIDLLDHAKTVVAEGGPMSLSDFLGSLETGELQLANQRAAIIQNNAHALRVIMSGNSRGQDVYRENVPPVEGIDVVAELADKLKARNGVQDNPTTLTDVNNSTEKLGEQYWMLRRQVKATESQGPFIKLGRGKSDATRSENLVEAYGSAVFPQLEALTGQQIQELVLKTHLNLGLPIKEIRQVSEEDKNRYYAHVKAKFKDDLQGFNNYLRATVRKQRAYFNVIP